MTHTNNRKQHSPHLEEAINRSATLSDSIHEILGTTASVTTRERLALAYFSLSMEHREAILLLVSIGASASATALHRPMLEALIAGAWIDACATDKEVDAMATLKRSPSKVVTMVTQLRKAHPLGDWFRVLYEHYGVAGDYAHGHLRQLSRWLGKGEVGPRYSDGQMIELLWNAGTVGLLAAALRENLMGRPIAQLMHLLESWTRAHQTQQALPP
jgi:hypothetical protein